MGTPAFAECSLRRLYEDGHDICGVFTQPDKPQGRGMKLSASPVKLLALEHGTSVFQPGTLRDGTALSQIKELGPELIVVVAYGKILPSEILDLPEYGCVNVHASKLPKYRGAAPIQWAVLNGDTETGVTTMYMSEELDTGDIIAIITTDIGNDETSGELFSRLMVLGAELLSETIMAISEGWAGRTPQNHAEATFAPPLAREMSSIDWNKSSDEIINLIRGLNPWPIANCILMDKKFKIFKAEKTDNITSLPPGNIVAQGKNGLEISCSDGTVIIKELQAAGGKRMPASEYLKGHSFSLEKDI